MSQVKSGDIKLMASERLTDNPDGGGRITGNPIVDGQANNLFEDISDLDRTYGDVSLRKAFVAVRTNGTPQYYGAHVIVDEIPEDDNVTVSLFSTEDWDDERTAARDRIESYVVAAPISRLRLLGNQLEGQRQITTYTLQETDLPTVGEVLLLSTEDGPHAGEKQYVRIIEVSSEIRTFVDGNGPFDRKVAIFEIGAPLNHEFYGSQAQRYTGNQPDTVVRRTTVAAASRYYTTQPVVDAIDRQDLTVHADSIFTAIVPSATTETPITNARALSGRTQVIPAGDPITRSYTYPNWGPGESLYLFRPAVPGSIVIDGQYTDDATGVIRDSVGNEFATISYADGIMIRTAAGTTDNPSIAWQPGAAVSGVSWTLSAEITMATRGYNYNFALRPRPWKGTVLVDYISQGRWYRLRDHGDGTLVGDVPDTGTGQVNFQAGTVLATLAALPDVGSRVIVYWGTDASHSFISAAPVIAAGFKGVIPGEPATGTIQLQWTVGGTTYNAQAQPQFIIN